MTPKTHLAVQKKNQFGGYNSGTLCGRESGALSDDINAEIETEKVTCKVCKQILANPKSWRYRKWLA